jgi:hypothetical protein
VTAREEALALFEVGLAEEMSGPTATAAAELAARLGAEIRAEVERELREEFELDLKRIREETFDLGVRTAIRLASEQRAISPTAGKQLLPKLAAQESRKRILDRIRGPLGDFVHDAIPEEWSEISDSPIVRTDAEEEKLVDELLAIVEGVLP